MRNFRGKEAVNGYNMDIPCIKDKFRPAFSYIKVTKEWVGSTDAHLLVRVKTDEVFHNNRPFIEGIPDDGMYIHMEDWKKMVKGESLSWKIEGEVIKIHVKKKRDMLIEVSDSPNGARYPDLTSVIPKRDDIVPMNSVTISPAILSRLCKTLSAEQVTLNFTGSGRAIIVDVFGDAELRDKVQAVFMSITDFNQH